MLRCFEQEVSNMSYMTPKQKMKLIDWYVKGDPSTWVAADSDCMDVPVRSTSENDDLTEKIL